MVENTRYFKREDLNENGVISYTYLRLVGKTTLEYLNREYEWKSNQEWFVSMFYDGEVSFVEVPKKEVDEYIAAQIMPNKKLIR